MVQEKKFSPMQVIDLMFVLYLSQITAKLMQLIKGFVWQGGNFLHG